MSEQELRGWLEATLPSPPSDSSLLSGLAVAQILDQLSLSSSHLSLSLAPPGSKARGILMNWNRLSTEISHSLNYEISSDTIALILSGDLSEVFAKVLLPMYNILRHHGEGGLGGGCYQQVRRRKEEKEEEKRKVHALQGGEAGRRLCAAWPGRQGKLWAR